MSINVINKYHHSVERVVRSFLEEPVFVASIKEGFSPNRHIVVTGNTYEEVVEKISARMEKAGVQLVIFIIYVAMLIFLSGLITPWPWVNGVIGGIMGVVLRPLTQFLHLKRWPHADITHQPRSGMTS